MGKYFAVMLVMMLVFTMTVPAFAVDATTSATEWTEPTTTPATPTTSTPTTPTPVTTTAPTAGSEVYVVVKGDVFWKIAMDHGLTTAELVKLNPQIANPAVIEVGQKIIVKVGGAVSTPATPTTPVVVAPVVAEKLYSGLGMIDNFRVRTAGHHQFNVVATSAVFNEKGQIVAIDIDVTELAMEEFQWPADTATAAELAAHAAKLDAEIMTKGELKENYGMAARATTGLEWYQQMENFEDFFIGKTPSDIRAWYIKNTDAAGKPIKIGTELKPEDQAKVDKLSDAEKAVLADVITGATMSLHDGHGFFVESIEKAYKNRVLVETIK
jgi:LysM repeat protein